MAVTVTANLTDITLGEAGDDTYWTGEDGNSTEVYRQGSASQAWIVGKNSNETASFDAYTSNGSATFDLSGTGVHLYITMKCDIAPYIDYVHIGLQSDTAHGSTTSGTDYWTIVDNTTNIEWTGGWQTFILDVNSTTKFSTSGTLDLSAITDVHVNVDNSNSGNIRSIENTYIDVIRFGTGLTMTGTVWDWDDVATTDANSSNKYDIVRKVGPGVYEVNGQLNVGNGATTTTPSSSNEVLFFKDPSTSGDAGGAVGKIASGFYKLTFQGSGLTGTFNNMSVIASSNYPFILDADDSGLGTSAVTWTGGVVIESSSVLLKANTSYKNMTFESCGQIEPTTATFQGNIIQNSTAAGAVLAPSSFTNLTGCNFNNNTVGIEHDTWNGTESGTVTTANAAGTTLIDSAATFTGNVAVNDIVYNETDKSYGTVTSVDSNTQITHSTLTGGTDNDWDLSDAYSIATPFSYTDLTFSSNTNDVDNTTSPANVVAISKAGTTDVASFPTADFVVIQGSVTVQVNVVDNTNTAIEGVAVAVFLSSDGTEVLNTTTNASGVASATYAGTTPADVYIRARDSSTGGTRYISNSTSGTIASGTGLNATVVMQQDTIVGS